MEKLVFNTTIQCDFCCKDKKCSETKYGTTNYTRFICEACAKKINNTEHSCFDLNK